MSTDDFQSNRHSFLHEFEEYIGTDFITKRYILIGDSTRFDQLNFDIVDEVVTEHLINQHFGTDNFTCDEWPETIGELLAMVSARLGDGELAR